MLFRRVTPRTVEALDSLDLGDSPVTAAVETRSLAARDAERFAALEAVGHHSSDIIIVLNEEGNLLYGNPVAQETFGITPEEGVGTNSLQYIHPDDVERVATRFSQLLETPGASISDTIRTITKSGDVLELEIVSTNSLDNPAVGGVIVNGRNTTAHRDYITQLQAHEERFRLAFEHNMAPMVFTDLHDRAIAVNDAFCGMVGFSREELLGKDSKHFTLPDDVGITEAADQRLSSDETDRVRYTKRYLRRDGRIIISEVSRSAARDESGNTLYYVASERDITEERLLTEQLSHQALHDPLTGLANRVLFEDRLAQAHARVVRNGGYGAVLLLDLDDFKGVNDTYGHLIGDQLLVGIARRFELVTRTSDTLCRFGGDEFLYLAEGLTSAEEAEQVARRLLNVLATPFSFDDLELDQHASIGVVLWDATSKDSSGFVRDADVSLYEAKREQRGSFSLFTRSMRDDAVSRFSLMQELRHAHQVGDLSMHYQPIVNLDSAEVIGFEALMRWQHAERGWVAPSTFIAIAEQSNLVLELGKFALRSAVTEAVSWQRRGESGQAPFVTVNLSAHQFHDPKLVPTIEQILSHSGLSPDRLIIEITESATLLDVTETMSVIHQLNRIGIGFALDDFGTGFSSLSYLAALEPKIIKIDQSFVRPTAENSRSDTLLSAIISLGKNLRVTMLAEGIETDAQLEKLRDLDCELGQGYLFSPAVPAEDAIAFVGRKFRR